MKKIVLLGVTLAVAVIFVAACSGGGGGGGAKVLTNGSYTLDNAGVTVDACNQGASIDYYADGDQADVTVNGTTVEMDFDTFGLVDYEIQADGVTLIDEDVPAPAPFNFRIFAVASANGLSNTYACTVTRNITYDGEITAKNKFHLIDSVQFVVTSGGQCAAVAQSIGFGSFPCVSSTEADAAK